MGLETRCGTKLQIFLDFFFIFLIFHIKIDYEYEFSQTIILERWNPWTYSRNRMTVYLRRIPVHIIIFLFF